MAYLPYGTKRFSEQAFTTMENSANNLCGKDEGLTKFNCLGFAMHKLYYIVLEDIGINKSADKRNLVTVATKIIEYINPDIIEQPCWYDKNSGKYYDSPTYYIKCTLKSAGS